MSHLPHLMSPITVRGKTYPNRIVAAPALGMIIRPDGTFPPGQGAVRAAGLARGGCGGVYIGETPIDTLWADRFFPGYGLPLGPAEDMYTDFTQPDGPKKNSWRRIAMEVHEAGSLVFDQLFHAGNMRICTGSYDDRPIALGPMRYTRADGQVVKAMDEEDMQQVCMSFARAAAYMKDAGFDGIMIHAGHGWLLNQFLAERCNRRTDEYGGSIEKRCGFPVRVVKAVREAVGEDFIIEVRVSGEETGVPDGYKVEQTAAFAQMIEGFCDIFHLSNGHYNLHLTSRSSGGGMYDPHNCNLEQGIYIKEHTKNMLVNVVGAINNPEHSDMLIGEGKIDFISMATQLNADINFGNKCRANQAEEINRCVRCIYCYGRAEDKEDWEVTPQPMPPGGPPPGEGDEGGTPAPGPRESFCTVNPENGIVVPKGSWPEVTAAKKLLIAGGGPAGMMAAITAADRGHFVTLVEKTDKLGGTINFVDHDPYKEDYRNYRDLLLRRMAARRIKVLYNTVLTPEIISEERPDLILAAVGASAKRPELPGIENTTGALEAYCAKKPEGDVVILGGGLHACELSICMAETAKSVTVLKLGGRDGEPVPHVRKKMGEMGVIRVTDRNVQSIAPGLVVTDKGEYRADSVIFCAGLEPRKDAVEEIKAMAGDIPVKLAGDCERATDVAHAVRAAYVTAMQLC